MHEHDGIGDHDSLCCVLDDLVAPVVVECWSDVETIMSAEIPRFSCGSFGVGDDSAPWGTHGCRVEVVGTIEVFPG